MADADKVEIESGVHKLTDQAEELVQSVLAFLKKEEDPWSQKQLISAVKEFNNGLPYSDFIAKKHVQYVFISISLTIYLYIYFFYNNDSKNKIQKLAETHAPLAHCRVFWGPSGPLFRS